MTKAFNLINSECQFTQEIINIGITQIRKADCQKRGLYYQAFTCLSVGLERLMKLILVTQTYKDENRFLSEEELKGIGHKISDLYSRCREIGIQYNIRGNFSENDELYNKIIHILSEFAETGHDNRYYNLNYVSRANDEDFILPKDAIHKWYDEIDGFIYNNKISAKVKEKTEIRCRLMGQMLSSCSLIDFDSEDGSELQDGESFLLNKNRQILCQEYRVLFVAQIVRYLSEILNKVADNLDENIPFVSEYFVMYRGDDATLRKKKDFTRS